MRNQMMYSFRIALWRLCAALFLLPSLGLSANTGATVYDTFERTGTASAWFFCLQAIDDEYHQTALRKTGKDSPGMFGGAYPLSGAAHAVEARKQRWRLSADSFGLALTALRNVVGEIEFEPASGASYRVNGVLGKHYRAVWIEDSVGNRVSAPIEEYDEGDPDAVKGRSQLLPPMNTINEGDRHAVFSAIRGGEAPELVRNKVGQATDIQVDKPSSLNIGGQYREIHLYDSLGRIEYGLGHDKKMYVDRVIAVAKPVAATSDAIRERLDTRGEAYQAASIAVYRAQPRDVSALDAVSESLWAHRDAQDPYEIDGAAYLTKALAESGNGRYRAVLKQLAESAASKKLRKYARKTAKRLPESDEDPWMPRPES